MNKFDDLTGKKYGRLTVIERVPNLPNSRVTRWKCICECGKSVEVNRNNLLHKKVRSCGCLATELTRKRTKKYNNYIPLFVGYTTNTNKPFFIDYEDIEKIKEYCWHESKNGYIETRNFKTGKRIFLHKLILNTNKTIDHINRNKADNRKLNLRIVTPQQNCMNKSIQKNNKSGTPGVYFDSTRNKWVASLTYKGKRMFKRFETKEEAIETRKKLEKIYFKEYAPK
jgi:hypothetical protein